MITIVNSRPGLIRAGVRHPEVASYEDGHFSPGDLLILVQEPAFVIVTGARITEADVIAMIPQQAAEKPAKTGKGA